MFDCQLEIELKLNHKFEKVKPKNFSNFIDAKESLKLMYNEYIEKWKKNKIFYDSNGVFCYVFDREHGNEFKARIKDNPKKDKKDE